jgi:hypothetical protein
MEKGKVVQNMHFEHMLWQNELEFNRRELAIFERFLVNREGIILRERLNGMISQLHHFVRLATKILDEITSNEKQMCLDKKTCGEVGEDYRYLREEMFYYEQNYRQFKKEFRAFAAGLEYA